MDEIRVALAEAEDAFALAALHLQAGIAAGERPRPGYLDEMADWWLRRRSTAPAWLARTPDGDPVGVLAATAVPLRPTPGAGAGHRFEVDVWFVPVAWRRRGIGSRLVAAAQAHAGTTGARELRLPVTAEATGILDAMSFARSDRPVRAWRPSRQAVVGAAAN